MPAPATIASRQHPIVKRFRAAARGDDARVVLLDGEHLVREALASRVAIDVVLARVDAGSAVVADAERHGIATYRATAAAIDAASPVRQPSGVVALARWTASPLAAAFAPADEATGPVIGLVSVQDPGNVGSVIRSADALGARAVLALDDTADPAGWKALRGAMGSTFRLPVARGTSSDAIELARRSGLRVAAAVARADDAHEPDALEANALVLLGHEGAGLPPSAAAAADVRVAVPMRHGVDSLNVAVTAALILDAVRRATAARRA